MGFWAVQIGRGLVVKELDDLFQGVPEETKTRASKIMFCTLQGLPVAFALTGAKADERETLLDRP